jgi:exonuclease III
MDLTFGTWNIQTMPQPGKMMEIADEVLKLGMDLVALQEIRWQGHGEINRKNFTVICSGPENRTGQYGTGFIYQERLKKVFWNGNQLMIDYVESELEGNLGT